SYRRLSAFLTDKGNRKKFVMTKRDIEAASHAPNVFDAMASYTLLDPTPEDGLPESAHACAIDVDRLIARPTFIFLGAPAGLDAFASRTLVRAFIHLLFQRLQDWEGDRVKHVYVAIDEAQEALQHRSMRLPIVQGRAAGLRILAAHQTLED